MTNDGYHSAATLLHTGQVTPTLVVTPNPSRHDVGSQIELNPFTFSRSRSVAMPTGGGHGTTLVARRPSSHHLSKLRIARSQEHDAFDRGDVDETELLGDEMEDVEEEGKQLFSNFLHEQASQVNPEAAREIEILTPAGYKNPMWAKAGRELRHMADIFANTAERRRVQQKASEVSTNISYAEFRDLLAELFAAGGITKERIVVLFYFCSDVALRCLSRGSELCSQFVGWSFSFIKESVCSWVRSHGGWGEVMCSSFNSLPRVLLFTGVIVLAFGAIRYFHQRL